MIKNDTFSAEKANSMPAGAVMSANAYNLAIGLFLLWGLVANWFMVTQFDMSGLANVSPWVFFGGYFVSCLVGVFMFTGSDKPLVSFIGYNLVVLPFGVVLNLVVSQYDPAIVGDAVTVTAMVTILMMALGAAFPSFFLSIGRGLFVALICVIIAELVMIFVFKSSPDIMDWIVAALFCGYIGYDWARAQAIPKTLDNAIDSAASIYMDVIILFMRILEIMSRR
jgi:FtsH-binding integral membrane protein